MVTGKLKALSKACYAFKTWEALGGLFLPQPDLLDGLFLPDEMRQTGATQPNISQRNRLVHYMAC
jgi:hypothetical protein